MIPFAKRKPCEIHAPRARTGAVSAASSRRWHREAAVRRAGHAARVGTSAERPRAVLRRRSGALFAPRLFVVVASAITLLSPLLHTTWLRLHGFVLRVTVAGIEPISWRSAGAVAVLSSDGAAWSLARSPFVETEMYVRGLQATDGSGGVPPSWQRCTRGGVTAEPSRRSFPVESGFLDTADLACVRSFGLS